MPLGRLVRIFDTSLHERHTRLERLETELIDVEVTERSTKLG